MVRLCVEVSDELHKCLKIYAFKSHTTLRKIVIEAIETRLGSTIESELVEEIQLNKAQEFIKEMYKQYSAAFLKKHGRKGTDDEIIDELSEWLKSL